MLKVCLFRDFFKDEATLGTLYVYDKEKQIYKSESLERGWVDNKKNISCIPVGRYPLVLEYSNKFRKKLWEIKDVPNRSECKIHAANYWYQLNGCISPGYNRRLLDNDTILDVTSSNNQLKLFHKAMGSEIKSEIYIFDIPKLLHNSI